MTFIETIFIHMSMLVPKQNSSLICNANNRGNNYQISNVCKTGTRKHDKVKNIYVHIN